MVASDMDIRYWPLDDGQRAAVRNPRRLVMITGGPGSGKTHMLLARCAQGMLNGGVEPSSMQLLVRSRAAAERARRVLAEVGPCQVDTVPDFCARLLRQFQGGDLSLLSDHDAAEVLGGFLSETWDGRAADVAESSGRRPSRVKKAMRMLQGGPRVEGPWAAYIDECVHRGMYDRWRVVEMAADWLGENPAVQETLRRGSCLCVMADDVHLWGASERQLLQSLVGDDGGATLVGDPGQIVGDGEDVMAWFSRRWEGTVWRHRLTSSHRSTEAICDLLERLSGEDLGCYLPRGEEVDLLSGETPGESAALGAEKLGEWISAGVDPGEVAVIDLQGDGGGQGIPLQMMRAAAGCFEGRRDDGGAADALDCAATLRLVWNRRNVSALSGTWRQSSAGGARRVAGKLVRLVVSESRSWNGDLVSAAGSLVRSGSLSEADAMWAGELGTCQAAFADCLERGGGVAEVLDWRRRQLFDPQGAGSAAFSELVSALSDAEGRGQLREGLVDLLDGLALGGAETSGKGQVEVLGVSEVAGREWKAVCVMNAVRLEDDLDVKTRERELYVASSRARRLLAVCDYRFDYRRRPVVSLLSGKGMTTGDQ